MSELTQTAAAYEPSVSQINATYRLYLRNGFTVEQAGMLLLYSLGLPPIKDWREPTQEQLAPPNPRSRI